MRYETFEDLFEPDVQFPTNSENNAAVERTVERFHALTGYCKRLVSSVISIGNAETGPKVKSSKFI